jgi:cytochrome c556
MKLHALWVAAIALGLAACGDRQQAEPQQPETSAAGETGAATIQAQVDQAFIEHMHMHAEQLDELMFALADEDLEASRTPAYWLSRHETVKGIPDEWQQYVVNVRRAALQVEQADDLDSARAAGETLSASCQECHAAAGVMGAR